MSPNTLQKYSSDLGIESSNDQPGQSENRLPAGAEKAGSPSDAASHETAENNTESTIAQESDSPSIAPPHGNTPSASENRPQFKSRWTDPNTPTSPSFRYPVPSESPLDTAQAAQTSQDSTATLQLRPSALVAEQDRRAAVDSEDENQQGVAVQNPENYGFQMPKPEDEDFYDSRHSSEQGSTTSAGTRSPPSSPALSGNNRPPIQTSPAPEGCNCGSPWHSSTSPLQSSTPEFISKHDASYTDAHDVPAGADVPLGGSLENSSMNSSGELSAATLSTLPQVPAAPANSPHDEPSDFHVPGGFQSSDGDQPHEQNSQRPDFDNSYVGPPGSSDKWPHYYTPSVEDEDASVIKCYGPVSPGSGGADLPRSQSSGWLEGNLDRTKNASSGSIHAKVKNIDEVKNCPAVYSKSKEVPTYPHPLDPMLEGQGEATQTVHCPSFKIADVRDRTPEEVAEVDRYLHSMGISTEPQLWPGEGPIAPFLGNNQEPSTHGTSARAFGLPTHQARSGEAQRALDAATNGGVIDGCQAVMNLMAIVGSRPSNAWRRQYNHLLTNAHRGNLEPLIQFVRKEAERVTARNASARAAENQLEQPQDGEQTDDLSETSISSDTEEDSGAENAEDARVAKVQNSQGYAEWLCKHYPTDYEYSSGRVVWIANPATGTNIRHARCAKGRIPEAEKPFMLTLGHYFADHGSFIMVRILVLAVKITLTEGTQKATTYAELLLRDTGYYEKFSNPARVQAISVRGELIDLDSDGIARHINDLRRRQSRVIDEQRRLPPRSARRPVSSPSAESSSSSSGITLRRHSSDEVPVTGCSNLHLTASEAKNLHPNIFANKGLTVVPPEEFPPIPADPYNFVHHQLQIGHPPSTVFVNCERCHKLLASFENVIEGPTVARRSEDELGDTYIVSTISSLQNIIASVDKVSRVWVHVGTEKYFMRANEHGSPRAHGCVPVVDEINAEMLWEEDQKSEPFPELEHAAATHGGLPPPPIPQNAPHHHARPRQAQGAEQHHRSVPMPTGQSATSPGQNSPTALMVTSPCTIVAIRETTGDILGVYQGVLSYYTIFRGPGEAGESILLSVHDPYGSFIGRLSRVRYFEVSLMNGQLAAYRAHNLTIEAEVTHNPNVAHARSPGVGLRGGAAPSENWESETLDGYDESEVGLRGGADDESTLDGTESNATREEWISTESAAVAPVSHSPSNTASCSKDKGKGRVEEPPNPHMIRPTAISGAAQFPKDDSDRIPDWLKPSTDPLHVNEDGPAFSEEHKKWLRDMYTRPANSRCAVIDPQPSFQDFVKDRKAGRPATTASGAVHRPDVRGTAHDGDIATVEYIHLPSDSDEEQTVMQDRSGSSRQRRRTEKQPVGADATVAGASTSAPQSAQARPYEVQASGPNQELLRILNKFLHEQAVKKARKAYIDAMREY